MSLHRHTPSTRPQKWEPLNPHPAFQKLPSMRPMHHTSQTSPVRPGLVPGDSSPSDNTTDRFPRLLSHFRSVLLSRASPPPLITRHRRHLTPRKHALPAAFPVALQSADRNIITFAIVICGASNLLKKCTDCYRHIFGIPPAYVIQKSKYTLSHHSC